MLLGKIVDQTLQVRGVMCQSVVIVKSVDLYVIQSEVLVNIDPYKKYGINQRQRTRDVGYNKVNGETLRIHLRHAA